MTGNSISGNVDNGRQAEAVFPFYTGAVGIRHRGDRIEASFFSSTVRANLPAEGTLDGAPVTIIELTQSVLGEASRKIAPTRAIVATVLPARSE